MNEMKVLFLDDNKERTKEFSKNVPHAITVSTAEECVDKLKKDKFDVCSLDHDLGGEEFVDSGREDCGMEVVRWIMQNEPVIELIVVHSWNIPAAKRMTENLRDSGYSVSTSPFTPYTMIGN